MSNIEESTRKNYNYRMKKLSRSGVDLQNVQNVIDTVKGFSNNEGTQKSYLSAIMNYIQNTSNDVVLYDKYKQIFNNLRTKLERKAKLNIKSCKEKSNWVEWENIKRHYNELQNKVNKKNASKTDKKLFALMSFYVHFPVRRLEDFSEMRIYDRKPKVVDEDYNYLIMAKRPYIILNNYKTKKSYGTQKFYINNELKNILNNYAKNANVSNGELLFKTNNKAMQRFLSRNLSKLTNKNISLNMLRHSYICNMLQKKYSLYTKEKIASKMGHSIVSQLEYNKIK
jgi:integrase